MTIIIAPFSNSDIRDWPALHFRDMIRLLLDGLPKDIVISVTGTQGQRLRANPIVRKFPASRVRNDCGRIPWADLVEAIRNADCVIGNNSGVAHLGGYFGVPTVCIFGGSHQRTEWRALGRNVAILTRSIGCSPCHLDHNSGSRYDKACLRLIEPATVASAVLQVMDGAKEAKEVLCAGG